MRTSALLTLGLALCSPLAGRAQGVEPPDSLEARVWLDRGDEPVVRRGDEVRVYYRTSHDAYAAIFRIDTDGVISLIFPQHPDADYSVHGGRDYRLIFPQSARWHVDEDPGVGYFFMVASPEPMDFSQLGFDPELGWDLGEVGATVYEDPYVAIDDYVAAIVPDWEVVPYGLDFLSYSVGETHEYPRFLCYDCHGYRSYASWNPYAFACSSYRVVIWDDPYFYPRYRYVGTRVVYARPIGPRPRYGVVTRVGTGYAPLVRTRAAPPRRTVEYKEPARRPAYQPRNPAPTRGSVTPSGARPSRSGALPNRTRPPGTTTPAQGRAAPPSRSGSAADARPSASGSAVQGSPRARAVTPPDASGATERRPTLQRRAPTAPSARLPARSEPRAGTTSRGTTGRGTTTRSAPAGRPSATPGSSGGARAPRAAPRQAPARVVPRSGSMGRATPARPPSGARSAPRPAPRAATSRPPPRAGSSAPARRPSAGPSSRSRPPARAGTTTRRRPGGRGG